MKQALWIFLTASVATAGFAALMHAPRRSWIVAGLLGGLGYAVYWALLNLVGMNDALSMFLGCLLATFLAQAAARVMKIIATVFVSMSIIPCVPGLGLYRCMSLLATGQTAEGAAAGVTAMMEILMITLALVVSGWLARVTVFRYRRAEKACNRD